MDSSLRNVIATAELITALALGMFGGAAIDKIIQENHRRAQAELMISLPMKTLSNIPINRNI